MSKVLALYSLNLFPITGNMPAGKCSSSPYFCYDSLLNTQPRTQGICSWGAKYPGMAWSRDPWILRKMAYCLLGSGE